MKTKQFLCWRKKNRIEVKGVGKEERNKTDKTWEG